MTHLWTIPFEIKYYFLIPIICLSFYSFKRFTPIFFSLCLIWIGYDQLFNVFHITVEEARLGRRFKDHFAVFFIGSAFAMGYFLTERSEKLMSFIKQDSIQNILKFASLAVGLYGWVFHAVTKANTMEYM